MAYDRPVISRYSYSYLSLEAQAWGRVWQVQIRVKNRKQVCVLHLQLRLLFLLSSFLQFTSTTFRPKLLALFEEAKC